MPRDIAGAEPRTLLLAIDAIPFRVAEEATRRGAFAGWSAPSALVSPFPTVTHVAFASLFLPFGVAPSSRYELRHFDTTANTTVGGGPWGYGRDTPAWSRFVAAPPRGLVCELSNYVSPRWAARHEIGQIEREVLVSRRDAVVAYVGATDGLMHLYGDEHAVDVLFELDTRLARLGHRHREARGRPLRIVLFSDHGSGRCKIRHAGGFDRLLRDAGLRVVDRLDRPSDVVAPRFGLVNYGALYLRDHAHAAVAARAVAGHPAVELAAFSPEPRVVEVVSRSGRAVVRWRGPPGAQRFACDDLDGDPLRVAAARRRLAEAGLLDASGFASDDDWLRATAFGYYPDPLRRLALALTGDRIESRASVLYSLGPGWSCGLYSAVLGAWVRGGRLEGTHGGLDRDSTLGFLLADDPTLSMPSVVRADVALAPFAGAVSLVAAVGRPDRGQRPTLDGSVDQQVST